MTTEFHSFDPRSGHGLKHDPLNAIVGPRPIGWISSINPSGQTNLAPYSFFNMFCYKPALIGFSSTSRKDTLNNIEKTGEFVWNLVPHALVEHMNLTSATVPPDESEFELSGLEQLPSYHVAPPRVARSPVHFECKLSQIVELHGAQSDTTSAWLVLGEVIEVHIRRDSLIDGIYQTAAHTPVLRAGGSGDYLRVEAQSFFKLQRPGTQEEITRISEQLQRDNGGE